MGILILQLVVLILGLVTGNISIPSLLSPINEVISFFSFLTMYNSTCEEDVNKDTGEV